MIYRQGELETVRYRTERCFRIGEDWYIATREEGDIGPFKSRIEAERSVPRYIKVMRRDREYGSFARKLAIEGIWASTHYT
ncbi:DUF6316 family protein [Teredinibacter franksiae]|uniref:DUF6316 family protein n=1 Tax=Teredinibacter franksiae TaxID=2761453 RepID=UPI0016274D6D|nr:DUF6316 family protein [Teredinibacter franksiae]